MTSVSESQLEAISRRVSDQIGLSFPREKWGDLKRSLYEAANDYPSLEDEDFIRRISENPLETKEIEVLVRHLTVGETYFFRENQVFSILSETILPPLIRSRSQKNPHLRIWCAGCSTGEEAYSVAILLERCIPDIELWDITIHATDINRNALKKAKSGIYSEWSFRNAPDWLKERYFTVTKKDRYEIIPRIKKRVSFSCHNLVSPAQPQFVASSGPFDLILCRNVLMYFSQEQGESVVRRLYDVLGEEGWLIVSVTETSARLFSMFSSVSFPDAMLYQKKSVTIPDGRTQLPVTQPSTIVPAPSGRVSPIQKKKDIRHPHDTKKRELSQKPAADQGHFDPEALTREAFVHYTNGRYQKTVEICGKVAEKSPNNSRVMALLSRTYANMGNLPEAKEWCEKAIAIEKMNPEYHYLLASILREQGNDDDAVLALKRVLYLDHNAILAHYDLGNAELRQGNVKEASRHFRTAQKILSTLGDNENVPYSEGLNAAKLAGIIRTTIERVKVIV